METARIVLIFVLAVIVGHPASARQQDQPTQWVRAPSEDDIVQFSPHFANLIGVPGKVELRCEVVVEGTPQNCEVVEAFPQGLGFELAAKFVAATGIISPPIVDGLPQRTRFRFTVRFHAEDIPITDINETYTGPEPSPRAIELATILVVEQKEEFFTVDWSKSVEQLDSDQRAIVAGWLEELLPIDQDRAIKESAIMVARSVPLDELERYISEGTAPTQPSSDVWAAADVGFEGNDLNPRVRELRARYCARWSCDEPPGLLD